MNDKTEDFNKSELIKNLESLYDLEIKKSIETIDTDLLDETIAFGLELNELEVTLTPEEIEEKVRKIPFVETATLNTTQESVKGKTTKVKSHKILLIAAIISILVTIFAITSIAFDWNIFDELKNRFGTVADAPVNEDIDVNGITVVSNGSIVSYNNLIDAFKNENIYALYPKELPNGVFFKELTIFTENSKKKVYGVFNDANLTYMISFDTTMDSELKSTSTEQIKVDSLTCYVIEKEDFNFVQIYFEHEENLYMLSYSNKQDLIEIIENMKELQ